MAKSSAVADTREAIDAGAGAEAEGERFIGRDRAFERAIHLLCEVRPRAAISSEKEASLENCFSHAAGDEGAGALRGG